MTKYLKESYVRVLDALYDTVSNDCNYECDECKFGVLRNYGYRCSIEIVSEAVSDLEVDE